MTDDDASSDTSPVTAGTETPAYLGSQLATLEDTDPAFLRAYLDLAEHPWEEGPLEPKVKEFVLLAVSSATTALHEPAIREHVGRALDRGGTFEEVLEVLELTSILGMHSATVGYPILLEKAGDIEPAGENDEALAAEVAALVPELEEQRTFFEDVWEDIMAIVEHDPHYWEALYAFLRHPYEHGVLEPKTMEFIYIAIDVGTSHLYTSGLAVHIQNALTLGARPAEIMEVIQLASASGIQSVTDGMDILIEEAAARDALPSDVDVDDLS